MPSPILRLADRTLAKLNGVDRKPYVANVLTRLVNLWPASRVDQ